MLIRDREHLTAEESVYATHTWTKIDFLIYRKVDKSPVLAIEVDGYAFHRKGTHQAERDALKNAVLTKCGIPILRLSTVGSNERDKIRKKLDDLLGVNGRHTNSSIKNKKVANITNAHKIAYI